MTSNPPPSDPLGPYGGDAPLYGQAPMPGGAGSDPYASPTTFDQPGWTGQPGSPHPGQGHGPGQGPPSGPRRSKVAVVGSIALVTVLVCLALVGWFVWPGWSQAGAEPTTDPGPTEVTAAPDPTTDPTTDPTPDATTHPTSDPTTDPTTEPNGDDTQEAEPVGGEIDADGRMNGPGYSYDAPDGWSLSSDSGETDDGAIEDGRGSDITVWNFGRNTGACEAEIDVLQIWAPGTAEVLADREVGGAAATGHSLTGDEGDYYELYCVDVDGVTFELSLRTTVAARDAVQPLFVAALDSWTWA